MLIINLITSFFGWIESIHRHFGSIEQPSIWIIRLHINYVLADPMANGCKGRSIDEFRCFFIFFTIDKSTTSYKEKNNKEHTYWIIKLEIVSVLWLWNLNRSFYCWFQATFYKLRVHANGMKSLRGRKTSRTKIVVFGQNLSHMCNKTILLKT